MSHRLNSKGVLRQLLRVFRKHLTHSRAGASQYRDHALSTFRANAQLEDPAKTQQLLLIVKEYADLATNIHHHQELLQRYNIGVDPEERNKDMVRKTAARVGFELPRPGEKPPTLQRGTVQQHQRQQNEPQVDQQQEAFAQQQTTPDGQQKEQQQQDREGSQQREQTQLHDEGVTNARRSADPSMTYAQRLQGGRQIKSKR
eukprot:GHUV01011024.1.p1 GENE.GHUV01011024.1~~GHUV01011024.1.p1  ORF type:complete len:201 (+),score=60.85 GHUV01011024.1:135-737(+)